MDFKPNSHRFKEQQKEEQAPTEKKFEKVVQGSVKTKKKNPLTGTIVSEDAKNVKSFLLMDVIVPSIKNMIEDIGVKGIRMLLRGDTGSRSGKTNAEYVSYNKMSERRDTRRPSDVNRARLGRSYEDIVLENRGDAEEVLFRMKESLEQYGLVSIADFYDLVGESSRYTDHKYGWMNLDSARVVPVREGYIIDFPRAVALN